MSTGFVGRAELPAAASIDRGSRDVKHSYADARPSGTPSCDAPVALADGRRVHVAQWGELGAAPVLFLHGQPGSRLFCPDLAARERARVHLITFDRAGYGRSDSARTAPSYAHR
jgi:pimeloyl-ACP methyl ester carboxylesterase